jgi:uncharacterized protein (DUF2147 family)
VEKIYAMRLLFLLFFGLISQNIPAQIMPDAIVGDWMTSEQNATIRVFKHHDKYYGKLLWYAPFNEKDEGRKIDPSENSKYLNKMVMKDFVFDKNEWNSGEIDDLYKSKKYRAFVKLNKKNQLEVTGYILFRWLSQTLVLNKMDATKQLVEK